MNKKSKLLLVIAFSILLSSCSYIETALLNNDSLYGGGYIKNLSNLEFEKDINQYSYIEDLKPIDTTLLIISSINDPSKNDSFAISIFDSLGNSYDNLSQNIVFESEDKYNEIEGISTYRGSNYRNTSSYGYPSINSKSLNLVWEYTSSTLDDFKGFSGQPLIVKWPEETQNICGINYSYKVSEGTVEVIYGSLDGNIYFLDLSTGKETRNPINLELPIYSTLSVDPRGYPLLYAGTGYNMNGQRYIDMSLSIIDLIKNEVIYTINGTDEDALRLWSAFDSSVLIDKNTDTLIQLGENGIMYNLNLNTVYSPEECTISVNPALSKYVYTNPFGRANGIEGSPAAFKNLIFFADNGGLLQCVDINTLNTVWMTDIKDDSDSTVVLDVISDSEVYLYCSTEVNYENNSEFSYIYKFNALNGELIYTIKNKCFYDEVMTTGVTATPIIGKSDISDSIIYTINGLDDGYKSKIVSYSKLDGSLKWEITDTPYTISSPIAVYDENGKSYIIQGFSNGYMNLYDGLTGELYGHVKLEGSIDGTPAVFNNTMIIGTMEAKIYCIQIN